MVILALSTPPRHVGQRRERKAKSRLPAQADLTSGIAR